MGNTENLILSWRSVMMIMVCLPILISACILLLKPYEVKASRCFALFLLFSVLAVGPQIIGFSGFYDVWPELTFFPFNNELWLGPLFYLHAHLLIKGGTLGNKKYLLIPGVLQTCYYCWAFLGLGDYLSKWEYSKTFHGPYILPVESALAILFIVIAMYKVWKLSRHYKDYLVNTQSAVIEFEPTWLNRIIMALLLAGSIFIGLKIIPLLFDVSYFSVFPFQVVLMVIFAWLSIEAVWRLNQPFPKLTEIAAESKKLPEQEGEKWQQEAQLIAQNVLKNEWFLEPRFSLRELTKRMASNEAYVSRAINKGLNKTFNEFINQFRIEHAKGLLSSSQQPILNIALDSGFNSKATFNRVFRDTCGETPSGYRKTNPS